MLQDFTIVGFSPRGNTVVEEKQRANEKPRPHRYRENTDSDTIPSRRADRLSIVGED
jgi:hypothetical protein